MEEKGEKRIQADEPKQLSATVTAGEEASLGTKMRCSVLDTRSLKCW